MSIFVSFPDCRFNRVAREVYSDSSESLDSALIQRPLEYSVRNRLANSMAAWVLPTPGSPLIAIGRRSVEAAFISALRTRSKKLFRPVKNGLRGGMAHN